MSDDVRCENCDETFDADAPMIDVDDMGDSNTFCSWNCVLEWVQLAIDEPCRVRDGALAAIESYNRRIEAILAKGTGS